LKEENKVSCSKCHLEFEKGEMLFPYEENLDELSAIGLVFCALCSVPEGSPDKI
jgi:hypothetical protein